MVSIDRKQGRAGNAEVGLLALAFIVILGILGAVLMFRLRIDPGSGPASASGGTAVMPAQELPEVSTTTPEPLREPEGLRNSGSIEIEDDPEYKRLPKSFDGLGTIAGSIEAPSGVPFPASWRLVIEPSLYALGKDRAARRVLELDGNQRTFEELDLPMGAYRVYGEAEGFDCRRQEVLLYGFKGRPAHEAKKYANVMLRFYSASSLAGVVTDAQGLPASDLAVTVEAAGSGERTTVRTNGVGSYIVPKLREGEYVIYLGPPEAPLVEALEILHVAPQRKAYEHTLPPLLSTDFHVVDYMGRGVPDAVIRAHGPVPIEAQTGLDGHVRLSYLPPGQYRMRALDPLSKAERKKTVVLTLDVPDQSVQFALPRPRE